MSARLDAMITDPISRGYLATIDGVWADLVLSEFAFLEDRGGEIGYILFHQQDDGIGYYGPWGTVKFGFAPDSYPYMWLFGDVDLHGSAGSFKGPMDRLMRLRAPDVPLPPLTPLNQAAIAANLRAWADVLRSATDLF